MGGRTVAGRCGWCRGGAVGIPGDAARGRGLAPIDPAGPARGEGRGPAAGDSSTDMRPCVAAAAAAVAVAVGDL